MNVDQNPMHDGPICRPILAQLSQGEDLLVLGLDIDPADAPQSGLYWMIGSYFAPSQRGVLVGALDTRLTVAEAIDEYAQLVIRRWLDTPPSQTPRVIGLEEALQRINQHPDSEVAGNFADLRQIQAHRQAAEEVIRHTRDALTAVKDDLRLSVARKRLEDELETALAAHPDAALALLREGARTPTSTPPDGTNHDRT